MTDRLRLFAAVVVHGAIASQLDGLRMALGSSEVDRIPPHITLVPPVNVPSDALPDVLAALRRVARGVVPIPTTIGPVATFEGERPVVYAAIDDASGALARLASSCATGHLTPAARGDRHPYVPHLTLANRLDDDVADVAVRALGHLDLSYTVEAVTLLARDEDDVERRWRAIADVYLAPPVVRGRGGIEIELWQSRMVDPEGLALLGDAIDAHDGSGEPWAITGRVEGRVVSVARGRIGGGWCNVDDLVVAPGSQDQGFGSRTLECVEHLAEISGASVVAARPRVARVAEFFFGRGYSDPRHPGAPLAVKASELHE